MFAGLPELLPVGMAGILAVLMDASRFVLSRVPPLLAAIGACALVARERQKVGPLDLRGLLPPRKEMWFASLAACVAGAAMSRVSSFSWPGKALIEPGMDIARDLTTADVPIVRALLAALVASGYWTLVLAGGRALPGLVRRRAPARPRAG